MRRLLSILCSTFDRKWRNARRLVSVCARRSERAGSHTNIRREKLRFSHHFSAGSFDVIRLRHMARRRHNGGCHGHFLMAQRVGKIRAVRTDLVAQH
jgi:hypothetical protein